MATVTKRGSNTNVGGSTLGLSPTAQLNVGDFVVAVVGGRDLAINGVADNSAQAGAANTWTEDAAYEVAGQDSFIAIYSCRITRNVLTSDVVTATFAAVGGSHLIALFLLDPIVSSTPFDVSSSRRYAAVTSPWTSNATATTVQADEILIGAFNISAQSVNSTDANTNADAPWTEEYFLTAGSSDMLIGSRVVTATGAYAFSGTKADGTDGTQTALIATYKVAAVAGPATIPTAALQGVARANGLVQAVPLLAPFQPRDPAPYTITFLYTAPPVYSAVVAGGSNQGYRMLPVPTEPPPRRELDTRRSNTTLPTDGSYAATIPPVYTAITAGGTNQGNRVAPAPQPELVSAERGVRRSNTVLPPDGSYAPPPPLDPVRAGQNIAPIVAHHHH